MGNRYPTYRPLNMTTLRCLATSVGVTAQTNGPDQKGLTRASFLKQAWQMSERARVVLLKFETIGNEIRNAVLRRLWIVDHAKDECTPT
jgi:hypothetical protein